MYISSLSYYRFATPTVNESKITFLFHIAVFAMGVLSYQWMGILAPLFAFLVNVLTPSKYEYLKENSRRSFNFFFMLLIGVILVQAVSLYLTYAVARVALISLGVGLFIWSLYVTVCASAMTLWRDLYDFPPSFDFLKPAKPDENQLMLIKTFYAIRCVYWK